jgi:hypothetical protein
VASGRKTQQKYSDVDGELPTDCAYNAIEPADSGSLEAVPDEMAVTEDYGVRRQREEPDGF